jgi:hypothetical protein
MSVSDDIEKLSKMKEAGTISEAEFQAAKGRLLDSSASEKPRESVSPLRIVGALVIVLGGIAATSAILTTRSSTPSVPLVSDADRAALEALKAKERERAELTSTPSRYIEAGKASVYDAGIINTYSQVTSIEFKNASSFDVTDIKGHVSLLRSDGSELASVPFVASGELRSGESKVLNVSSNQVSGGSSKTRAVVESVHVR